ncbi:MAG: nucleotidyltransferase domain-containing protein, partial [SAR202 cluster bacterium]|nr:nucleotidyltransferase domain-containing protein [SAR202 cluster bacterium]
MAGSFAESLVKELDAPDVTAIIPVGSQARGDATQHSDWDLTCLTTVPPKDGSRNRLLLRDGRLVTAATTAVATMRAEPSKPESAIWVVPALRQAR